MQLSASLRLSFLAPGNSPSARRYRLVRLHLDAMDRVRQAKPQVPLTGNHGIALRDMWELERELWFLPPLGMRML